MVAVRDDLLEERRGRHRVHPDVAVDLVHRLTDTDHGGEMNHAVNPLQSPIGDFRIANVAYEQPNVVG